MRRVGVAVEDFRHVIRTLHERVVDGVAHDAAAHRHRTRGDALGERHDVRRHAIALGRERRAETAEAGDDFVEDQQDAVLVADRAQALQVALRRRQHAGRPRHRLDDDGRDGGRVMQRDDLFQIVGKVRAPLGLALGERLMLAVVGVREMVDARQHRAEEAAVGDHAADRNAAEADAVIAALAADQARARVLALGVVIRDRDLERGIDRLRARIGEEDVVHRLGRQRRDAAGELERHRMRELEGGRVVEFGGRAAGSLRRSAGDCARR